ncbi:hypothetical protein PUN28_002594 [Cardiocondyla obscurior]|uniref:Uncharacterized protein n=1 Tax=Cardiocondyla obscurior TaxID=286306 RepID=A0AAW2GV60_9HYME
MSIELNFPKRGIWTVINIESRYSASQISGTKILLRSIDGRFGRFRHVPLSSPLYSSSSDLYYQPRLACINSVRARLA